MPPADRRREEEMKGTGAAAMSSERGMSRDCDTLCVLHTVIGEDAWENHSIMRNRVIAVIG